MIASEIAYDTTTRELKLFDQVVEIPEGFDVLVYTENGVPTIAIEPEHE